MSAVPDNPCVECLKISKHGCCGLKGSCGLMLTNDEYQRHFQAHARELKIWQSEKFHIISTTNDELGCPHLKDGGCEIYQDRPIDCRLYPYVIRRFIERGRTVKIVFHSKSDCPDKPTLLHLTPEAKASELVAEFGRKVYGENVRIVARHEKGVLSRLLNRIEAMASRYFWRRN